VFSWTGLYGGVNIGYGWSESSVAAGAVIAPGFLPVQSMWSFPVGSVNGVIGGGQLGYNYQFAGTAFVVGLEVDFQGADLTGGANGIGASPFAGFAPIVWTRQTIDWFGTVRGRLGYSILPNLLVYGTGGFAYGGGSTRFALASLSGFVNAWGSEGDTRTGWTAGGGVEWAFWPNWSAKVEYLYVDLENSPGLVSTATFAGAVIPGWFAVNNGHTNRFHTVRAGLNYHFNLFAPAPVVATY
jgi:outer membrane immunogenic protein